MDFPTRGSTEGNNRRACQRAKRQLAVAAREHEALDQPPRAAARQGAIGLTTITNSVVPSLWRVASVLEQQDAPQKREAAVNYQRALEILRPLGVENRLTAEQNVGNVDPHRHDSDHGQEARQGNLSFSDSLSDLACLTLVAQGSDCVAILGDSGGLFTILRHEIPD